MPIGAGTFFPDGQFAFPRSYIRGIGFDIDGYTVTNTANVYYWTNNVSPYEVWTITVDSRFWSWNSNRWTLDHVITDFYFTVPPSPVQFPQPYTLQRWTRPSDKSQYLLFQFAAVDFGVFHYRDFPGAPGSYWMPPFLP